MGESLCVGKFRYKNFVRVGQKRAVRKAVKSAEKRHKIGIGCIWLSNWEKG